VLWTVHVDPTGGHTGCSIRIVFRPGPEARIYEFSGRGSFGRLLAGTTSRVSVVTPAGSESSHGASI